MKVVVVKMVVVDLGLVKVTEGVFVVVEVLGGIDRRGKNELMNDGLKNSEKNEKRIE